MGSLHHPFHRFLHNPTFQVEQQNHLHHHPIKYFQHIGIFILLLQYLYHPATNILCPPDVQEIFVQTPLDWSGGLPRYLNHVTPSTSSYPSLPYILNYISPYLLANFTSIRFNLISVSLLRLDVFLCSSILDTSIYILQLVNRSSGPDPSCSISTLDFHLLLLLFLNKNNYVDFYIFISAVVVDATNYDIFIS